MAVVYVICAILVFGLLIMIHEFGHFAVARLCGVFIKEFSIGMGPAVLQKKCKSGMKFSLRALPIGGYVSMKGEDEEEIGEDSFHQKSVWKRMAIVVAGAFMNLLLGFLVVLVIVLTTQYHATTTVADFAEDAVSSAFLEKGDVICKIGNVSVGTGEELTYEIMMQGDKPVDVTLERDGAVIVLEDVQFAQTEEQGILFGERDFYVYGVEKPGIVNTIKLTWHRSKLFGKMVIDGIVNLLGGRFPVTAMSGPIGVTGAVTETLEENDWNAQQVLDFVLYVTALITINLGIFNLIPFPALDGGRFFFLLIEAITRKKVPASIEAKIHFVGIVLLMALVVVIAGKDILMLILK